MKVAVITGASSGLGRAFAMQIANMRGIDEIWAIARREDRLAALDRSLPGKVRVLPLDLLDPSSKAVFQEVLEKESPDIKILVNAAGFGKFGAFTDVAAQSADDMLDLNCKALTQMTRLCLPYMRRGGRILNMGSASSFLPLAYFSLYAATKAFVVSFSRALNIELKSRGISVTAVCPGYVRTNFFDVAQQNTRAPLACKNFRPLYKPHDVVRTALRDAFLGKDVSVYGGLIKAVRGAAKVVPEKILMNIWLCIK